jgi:radial spoke head protein 4A
MARQVKVWITGQLDKQIITNPPFEGKEKNYLRAQIARIFHSTHLMPKGVWKLDEENPRAIVEEEAPEEGELFNPTTSEMKD